MRKIVFLLILSIMVLTPVSAQLRDYVCVVKTNLHENNVNNFEKIGDYFQEEGNDAIASIFYGFSKGFFGSGFVYVTDSGENYIITNRHVVAASATVDLIFHSKDGDETIYEDCPVAYISNELDIAILQFPEAEKVLKESLSISKKANSLNDGDEVWSAGFPGLLGEPSWQFAKGNVTNSMAKVEKLVDPDVTHLVQHSASIDPGNSGGPLLKKTGDSYEVIGINTWTVANRNNTYFSIPAAVLENVFSDYEESKEIYEEDDMLKAELVKNCKMLAAEAGSDNPNYQKIANYISYTFVAEEGMDSFFNVLSLVDKDEARKWEQSFLEWDPIETMRSAIFVLFMINMKGNTDAAEVSFTEINYSDDVEFEKGTDIRTNFELNGNKKEIVWRYESGKWKIVSMDLETKSGHTRSSYTARNSIDTSSDTYEEFGDIDLYLDFNVEAIANYNLMVGSFGYGGLIGFGINPQSVVDDIGLALGLVYYFPFDTNLYDYDNGDYIPIVVPEVIFIFDMDFKFLFISIPLGFQLNLLLPPEDTYHLTFDDNGNETFDYLGYTPAFGGLRTGLKIEPDFIPVNVEGYVVFNPIDLYYYGGFIIGGSF